MSLLLAVKGRDDGNGVSHARGKGIKKQRSNKKKKGVSDVRRWAYFGL